MTEFSLGLSPNLLSPLPSPPGPRPSQERLGRFLSSSESGDFSSQERRELLALVEESDPELFHAGLLHLAGRLENRDRIAQAAQLYSLVQNQSEAPDLSQRAESRLALLQGNGNFGDRAEFLASRFVAQATEPGALVAMGLGGAAFRVARLGLLGRLLSQPVASAVTRGFGARALASTGAFLAESTAFTLAGRSWQALSGAPQDWSPNSLGREWLTASLTLGALRGFGALGGGIYRRVHGPVASPWQNLYGQSAMLGGILSAHYVEGRLGLREETQGANALLDGFVTLLQFNIAGRLSREAFGRRWQSWERGLDLQAERLSRIPPRAGGPSLAWSGMGPRFATASATRPSTRPFEGPVFMVGPPDGKGTRGTEAPSNGSGPRNTATESEAPSSALAEKIPSWWPSGEILPETLRDFIDSLPDTTVIFEFVPDEASEGLTGRILMANRKVREKFGFQQDEIVGLPLSTFTRAEDAADLARMQQAIQQSSRIKFQEVRFVRKDGREIYCDISGVVRRTGGRTIGFAILQDVTQRRLDQAQILAEQVRFQALMKGIPDIIFRIKRDGTILDAHAERPENFVLPMEQIIGTKVTDFPVPPQLIDLAMSTIEKAFNTGETQLEHFVLPMPDGTHRFQEGRITASGETEVVATIRDVTEARQAEIHRIAAARAETFKLIGRGLAHDANNALVPLLMTIEIALKTVQRGAESGKGLSLAELVDVADQMEAASQSADRIKSMVASFRELSTEPERGSPFDLHSILRVPNLQALLGAQLQLRVRLSGESWLVPGPRENIHRVVQNLVVNARDAIQSEHGMLRIETDKVVLSAEDLHQLSAFSPGILQQKGGNFMRLRVQDNGEGIPHEILPRIFEPYFSTKSKHDGAGHGGLGLALTQKLVQDAGGFITVESSLGMGTTFDVYLPNADPLLTVEGLRRVQEIRGLPLLIVSQNQSQREALQAGLGERGFSQILTAHSAEQALELASSHPRLGALVTDYHLPSNQFGIHLMRQLRKAHPDLPVILWSEHDPIQYSGLLAPFGTVVQPSASSLQMGSALESLMLRRAEK